MILFLRWHRFNVPNTSWRIRDNVFVASIDRVCRHFSVAFRWVNTYVYNMYEIVFQEKKQQHTHEHMWHANFLYFRTTRPNLSEARSPSSFQRHHNGWSNVWNQSTAHGSLQCRDFQMVTDKSPSIIAQFLGIEKNKSIDFSTNNRMHIFNFLAGHVSLRSQQYYILIVYMHMYNTCMPVVLRQLYQRSMITPSWNYRNHNS